MTLRVYTYKNCDTCRKALKFLEGHGVDYVNVPIRETPPTKRELRTMLGYLDKNLRRLFNTSGRDYRALGLKDKMEEMTVQEGLEYLSSNGNLVKRPFVIGPGCGTVGFSESVWERLFR